MVRRHSTVVEVSRWTEYELRTAIALAAKQLIAERHLYQSVTVKMDEIFAQHEIANSSYRQMVEEQKSKLRTAPWVVSNFEQKLEFGDDGGLRWKALDLKTFCPTCNSSEAFNIVDANGLFALKPVSGYSKIEQVFVLSYLCQACKSVPQVFLIHQVDAKLTLSGRTPMEQVQVPKFIPKVIAKYYSGAVIAAQSGATLPALFMYRTVLEQWSRLAAPDGAFADTAIDLYMESLPSDFKDRFPSFRTIYSDLSAAMHQARADETLCMSVQESIDTHFEARKLFKLPDPSVIRKVQH